MLRKSTGTCAVLVLAGAAAACSSSSGGTSKPDTGPGNLPDASDAHVKPGKDGGSDGKAGGHDGGKQDAGVTGPTARFTYTGAGVPNLLDVPWPSDLYLSNGKIIQPVPGADAVVTSETPQLFQELGRLDGFSPIAEALFYVDDPADATNGATIDPTSLPTSETECVADGSSVFLLDLSLTGAAARVPCRAAFHDDLALNLAKSPPTTGFRPNVAIGPARGYVLAPGHQYAAVMTSRVKTTAGKALGASPDFAALSAPSSKTGPYTVALRKVEAALGSALGSDKVVDMAVYTTGTSPQVLAQLRTDLEAVAVPKLAWDAASLAPMGAAKFAAPVAGKLPKGFTDTLDNYLGKVTTPTLTAPPLLAGADDPNSNLAVRAHNKIAAIGTAVFQAQNYLSPAMGYALGGATFSYDSNGHVIADHTTPLVPIWVTFFVPTAAMPAGGYPVVIVQHGLGESRDQEPFNLANTFANAGWMVAAIDSVTFGARANTNPPPPDKVNNFAAGGGSYAGPDGLADEPTNNLNDMFGQLSNFGAIRDQFRQASIDTSQLARVLAGNPDLSALQTGATAPKIDASRIAYLGNSLGGIEGATAAAIEPLIQTFVLNVAGGGIALELADHSPRVGLDVALAGLQFGAGSDLLTESHPLINFWQQVIDPGDPLLFAPYVVTKPLTVNGKALSPKNILQTEVLYDDFVPNEANEALARAFGIGLAMPNVGSNAGVSTLAMVKDPSMIPDPTPFSNIAPDNATMTIHDTPKMGITAVLVQTGPGGHGADLQSATTQHGFAIPYDRFATPPAFVDLGMGSAMKDPAFSVACAYVQLQAMTVRFLADAFGGKVPNVTGFQTPVRDYDDDGVMDSTDPDVNNPKIH